MINLINVEGQVFIEYEIVGYQFPDDLQDDWCLLRVKIEQGDKYFEAIDPALEARDIIVIYEWFKCLSENKLPRRAHLAFTEPCIAFNFLGIGNNGVRLSIELNAELKPKFKLRQFRAKYSNWVVVFELDNNDFIKVLGYLREAAQCYPIRRKSLDIGQEV